jgi:hypothetical protein
MLAETVVHDDRRMFLIVNALGLIVVVCVLLLLHWRGPRR